MANNISKDYISAEKKSIIEYLRLIFGKYYEKDICELLVNKYIELRYYDFCDKKYSKYAYNIEYYLKEYAGELIINDRKRQNKIKLFYLVFKYIFYFDDVIPFKSIKEVISDIDKFRRDELNLNEDDFVNLLNEKYKHIDGLKKNFLKSIKNDKFELIVNNTNKKNVYLLDLQCNISFPKIYSSYSIKKVYNQGIINEDKIFIMYHLANMQVLENRIAGIYNYDYVVDFPISVLSKKEKLNRLLNTINDDAVRDNIIIKINYKDYTEEKDIFDNLIKEGYRFAINLDSTFKFDEELMIRLHVFSYILDECNILRSDDFNNIIYRK